MIKMIIKMDDDRIRSHAEYTSDKEYSTLDRVFSKECCIYAVYKDFKKRFDNKMITLDNRYRRCALIVS